MKNKVSILIPCYNGEKFLDRCFKCLLNQSYKNIEIIFVNDGSTDNSKNIVDYYEKQIKKEGWEFYYIYQNNSGAASAINTALKYVTGEYIMLYDVDDIIFEDAVKDKVEFLIENKEYDMVRNNGYYVNNSELDKILGLFSEDKLEKNNEYIFEDLILGKTNNWPASFMVRTKALFDHINDKNIYISQFGQNLQIMLPVAYFGKSGYIDKPLMKYIKHDDSHSACKTYEKRLRLTNGYEQNRVEIVNQLDISKEEKKEYLRKISILYYRIRMQIAYESKNINLFEEQYSKLIELNEVTKQDEIFYKRNKNRIFDKIYLVSIRLVNKLKRMINI